MNGPTSPAGHREHDPAGLVRNADHSGDDQPRAVRIALSTTTTNGETPMNASQPTGTARVNVIDGTVRITAPDATDTDIYHHAGSQLGLQADIAPWAEDEEHMRRADAALDQLGWKRTRGWTGGEVQTAPVTPA